MAAGLNGHANGHNGHHVIQVQDFYPEISGSIRIPHGVFVPDPWTKIFSQGVRKTRAKNPHLKQHGLLEVGVGVGINLVGLSQSAHAPKSFIGSDINVTAVAAAKEVVAAHGVHASIVHSNLLRNFTAADLKDVGHIVACIPQVHKSDLSYNNDDTSHYYFPDPQNAKEEKWNEFGLLINARLLDQASQIAPHATVTLNLSGRPGREHLESLFSDYGYPAAVAHSEIVHQHADTCLKSLAAIEASGAHQFEFYADPHGEERITAAQAEEIRNSDRPGPYHSVYVFSGTFAGGPA